MDTVRIEKKLTVATLGINAKEVAAGIEKLGDSVTVARIYGQATKYKETPSRFDVTKVDVRFIGTFEAVNLLTGEVINATSCFLPGPATDVTRDALDQEGAEAVIFGCEIGIRKIAKKSDDDKGYQFTVTVPKAPVENDPLAHIRGQMKALGDAKPAQIEAPKAEKKSAKAE